MMVYSAMWILAAQLSALLCLGHTEEIPIADDFNMFQREVIPSFPVGQRIVQRPLLRQGEQVLSPRGRRPVSSSTNNLKDFPPGRPSNSNIDSICWSSRVKVSYGLHNIPQTGFSHLSRQGNAINELEEGFTRCCLQSDQLRCAVEVWKNSMDNFCTAEFTVKTRHYHCCKWYGSEREACFSNEAPNPSYDTPTMGMLQEARDVPDLGDLGVLEAIEPCPPNSPTCQDIKKKPGLAFPPGKPKSSNIQNICKLGKYRLHTDKALSQRGYGFPTYSPRQTKAINRLEKEYKKCCKRNDEACTQSAWEKVLARFCAEEMAVKTVPHVCCSDDDQVMYHCFAKEAPYPEYDREVEALDLGTMTEDILEKLCGEFKLFTKKRRLPLLVTNLKDLCCSLPQDRKLGCAGEQKKKHIKTLCGARKDSWKDTENCCSKDEQERDECFSSYMQNVSVAVMGGNEAE
ncbi:extracellular matrix protein 1 isoform X2 [Pseudophryne corroboree]|uniref:extracellular matrix protein 1 isoform X2 n=1 Tax=Pseudophryne corroboree TaxID=495146 RepID=UPI0030816BBB